MNEIRATSANLILANLIILRYNSAER